MTVEIEKVTIRDRPYFAISIDGAEYIQRTGHKPGLEEPLTQVEKILIQICRHLHENRNFEESRDELSETDEKFMRRFGWEVAGSDSLWRKFDDSGRIIAREGDPVWERDLRIARE